MEFTMFGREKSLLEAVEKLDNAGIKTVLRDLMEEIIRNQPSRRSSVHGLYYEMLYIIFSFLRHKGFDTEDMIIQRNAFHALNRMETIQEINDYIEQLLQKYVADMKTYNKGTSRKIKKAIDYIRTHYAEELTLRSISEYLQLSENHLSRLFTKETGKSFISNLTSIRIGHAKELLNKTDKSLGEISELIGYPNQEHFSRVFKKYEGITPSAFRN